MVAKAASYTHLGATSSLGRGVEGGWGERGVPKIMKKVPKNLQNIEKIYFLKSIYRILNSYSTLFLDHILEKFLLVLALFI